MRDEEIREKIDSFPYWHFTFDLNGNLTRPQIARQAWRKQYFFEPLVGLLGGTLEGKRVLDLACNAGFWSLCAIEAGCDDVVGIDGRQMHVDQANFVFEVKEVEKSRYEFIASDIFALDWSGLGNFDVVLCPGLMYHVSKHVELMEKISEVNSDLLMIDTTLADIRGSAMRIWHDRTEGGGASVDYELVMTPTREAVRDLAEQFGYSVSLLKPTFEAREGLYAAGQGVGDYRRPKRHRRAFVCAKQTDLGHLTVETEPIERPKPQRSGPSEKAQRRSNEARQQTDEARREARRAERRADKAERLVGETVAILSKLFVSRRWQLANTLGAALQVLRGSQRKAPADRLLELKGEFRAVLKKSDRSK